MFYEKENIEVRFEGLSEVRIQRYNLNKEVIIDFIKNDATIIFAGRIYKDGEMITDYRLRNYYIDGRSKEIYYNAIFTMKIEFIYATLIVTVLEININIDEPYIDDQKVVNSIIVKKRGMELFQIDIYEKVYEDYDEEKLPIDAIIKHIKNELQDCDLKSEKFIVLHFRYRADNSIYDLRIQFFVKNINGKCIVQLVKAYC